MRILKKSDKTEPSVRISTAQNETIFYINRQQHSLNASEPITRIVVANSAASSAASYANQYSFQMVPLVESSFEYGENCSQAEIIKFFRLNKQGEIFLASYLVNSSATKSKSSKASQLLSLNMICFVNIRVLDLKNPFKITTSKELVSWILTTTFE